MNRILKSSFGALLLLTSLTTLAAQKMMQTQAKLKTVTVYLNAAELTHQVRLDIPEGTSSLVISNLSPEAREETVQVAFEKEGITILSSQFMREEIPFEKLADIAPLAKETLAEYKKLTQQREKLQAEKLATEKYIAGLTAQVNKTSDALQASIQKLNEFMQNVYEKQKSLALQLQNLTKDIQSVDLELKRVKDQLRDQGIATDQMCRRGQVLLQLRSAAALSTEVFVRYLANGAQWNHSYEIRGEMSQKPLKLISRASVEQNTGLFWNDVKLKLIYGFAQMYQHAPDLYPWTLRQHIQRSYQKRAMGLSASNAMEVKEKVAVMEESLDYDQAYDASLAGEDVDIASNMLNISYDIKIPYDILPNGRGHQIEIQSQELPVEYSYVAIPKLNTDVFLMATIKDYNKYNLFNSQANIVFEKMRSGSTYLTPTNQTNELPITLGVEPRIVVERKVVSDKSSDIFLSSNRERTFTYDILVRNNKKEAVNVILKDQYPISAEDNIKVELLESSQAEVNATKGELKWKISLAAGEAKTIRLSYRVRYPKSMKLDF